VSRAPRAWTTYAIIAALVGWALLVRLPFASISRADGDGALFWLIGHDWLNGHPPYAGLWDVKPPGIFLLYAGAAALFGADPVGGRIVAALAIGIAAAGLYRFGAGLLADRRTGLFAATLLPPFTLLLDGLNGKAELFAAPFLVWGMLLALAPSRALLPLLAGGALMGFAATIKQTSGFEIVFVLLALALAPRAPHRCAAFLAGLAIAPLGFCLYFAGIGAFRAFLDASLIGALTRLHGDGGTLFTAPLRLLVIMLPALPLLILGGIGWAERRRMDRAGAPLVWGWLGATALGAVAMRATYISYALPLLAPLCLAAGHALSTLAARARGLATALAGVVIACPILLAAMLPDAGADSRPPRIAAWLRAHVPGRPVYVVDYEPLVYELSGAPVPTRFPLPQHLLCDFPALPVPAEAEMARIMAGRPAALVVSAARQRMVCTDRTRVVRVMALAARAGYRLAASFEGPYGPIEIWIAPPSAAAPS
jgi:4-amino-4-deoxy-L-arabinose transferase-like glycosyltransferase